MKLNKRKYDINIDGINIRTINDFNRIDMSKSQRKRLHRKKKLSKKEWC